MDGGSRAGGGNRRSGESGRVRTVPSRQATLFGEEEVRPSVMGHMTVFVGELADLKLPAAVASMQGADGDGGEEGGGRGDGECADNEPSPASLLSGGDGTSVATTTMSGTDAATVSSSTHRLAAAAGRIPTSGYVRVGVRNLIKRTRVVRLNADGSPSAWNQVKHMPVAVPRSAAHPFGLVSLVLYGQIGCAGQATSGEDDIELGSVLFKLHDVIRVQRVVGWFPLRAAHFEIGSIYLELTFSYGLYGYGYSPQVKVPNGVAGEDAVTRRSEGTGRATMVPSAQPAPPLLPVPQPAAIGYAPEMAADVQALADARGAAPRFPLVAAAMSRLPHLMSALDSAGSRQERLGLLHAMITSSAVQPEGTAAETSAERTSASARRHHSAEQTAAFADYFKPLVHRRSGALGDDASTSLAARNSDARNTSRAQSFHVPSAGDTDDVTGLRRTWMATGAGASPFTSSEAVLSSSAIDEATRSHDLRVGVPPIVIPPSTEPAIRRVSDSPRDAAGDVVAASIVKNGAEPHHGLVFSNDLLPRNRSVVTAALHSAVASASDMDSPRGHTPRVAAATGMTARQRAHSSRQLMQMASGRYAMQRRSSVSIMAEREVLQPEASNDAMQVAEP
ncbi:uncharacterized protein AMSG_08291 [Thecamonas trahens ATCC 50062]|uniref:C2 NT-type domain-containing protein n=1 Tax=Thecamonas trahens ATCC 50062 TaxID=461836 RepID=A0A0L0DI97_THETB|nr:hypothetical protein AMSG_08291 [Thecamonas trahens ATCC 50062]KNC52037.1 hypothetical protein AMSG_08291 [Thecamonas trahens ATCC 50062]|eukprot:XP_013755619.1 hypothetical protein AMSG_08291 [Thecamonas trahens ATCC 50062]